MSGSELLTFLTSMPEQKVDSLYNEICTPSNAQKYEEAYSEALDELTQQSSFAEIIKLANFTDAYIESGGNNLEMLSDATKNVTPIIKTCMIACASNIDEFIGYDPKSRAANSYCLQKLKLSMAKSVLENEVIEIGGDILIDMIGVPGVDVLGALLLAGYDLHGAISMAHDYNMCCATHVS